MKILSDVLSYKTKEMKTKISFCDLRNYSNMISFKVFFLFATSKLIKCQNSL